jgi:hypothetical protein
MMDFQTYRPLALRTAKMFPTLYENLRHAALGLITEVGEFATEVKRIAVYGKPQTEEMRLHMIEELGDTQWYVPLAMFAMGIESLPTISIKDISRQPVKTDNLADLALLLNGLSATVSMTVATSDFDLERNFVARSLGMLIFLIDECVAPLLGTTGDQMRAENIAKLRLRYHDKYSDQAAEARADKGGLDATVS